MSELQFESGNLTQVFYNLGPRHSDRRPRLFRAPIDLLQWGAAPSTRVDTYVVTIGNRVEAGPVGDTRAAAGREAIEVGQEFGYYDGNVITLDMGPEDFKTNDSVWSVQFFGPI